MTLADKLLQGYEKDIVVTFQGREYPLWVLMEHLLFIVDKNAQSIPFHLNYQQCMLYIEMCKQRREGKPIRQNVLKARQLGYSTFIAGAFFIIAMFTPNLKVGVVADLKEHAQGIFKKYQYFYDHLDDGNPNFSKIREWELTHKTNEPCPLSYKPVLKYNKGQQMMETLRGNSTLEVIVAGEGAGRSNTYNLLHLSECAFFDNLGVTIDGLLECVSDKNLNSMVFFETTAKGFNEYKKIWDIDASGQSKYKAFFVPWYTNKDYTNDDYEEYFKTYGKEKELPLMEEWLYEKQTAYHLTNAQMMWYWDKFLATRKNKGKVLQEYPFCPTDSFLATGSCVFGAELVNNRKEEVLREFPNVLTGKFLFQKDFSPEGSRIALRDDKFTEFRNGEIKIFKKPIKGHPYVGTCDPNNGGRDSSVIQIIDNATMEQVAIFESVDMTLDQVAYQFYLLGKMYNWALLSSEMNLGQTVMDYLVRLNYPHLYIRQATVTEAIDMRISKKYGHITSKATRPQMIELFQIAWNEGDLKINDYGTLCQMETFQKVDRTDSKGNVVQSKEEATAGNHDDKVMALAAYFIVRNQQTFVIDKDVRDDTRTLRTFEEIQEWYEEKNRQKQEGERVVERFSGIRW